MKEYIEKFVTQSNMIEGIYVDPGDPLFDNHLMAAEIAIEYAGAERWLDSPKDHACLMQRNGELRPSGIGSYRTQAVTVGGNTTPPFNTIRNLMEYWSKDIKKYTDSCDNLNNSERAEACFKYHKWFECIHPFIDGNGRTGRIMWLHLWILSGLPEVDFLRYAYYDSIGYWRSRDWDKVRSLSLSGGTHG